MYTLAPTACSDTVCSAAHTFSHTLMQSAGKNDRTWCSCKTGNLLVIYEANRRDASGDIVRFCLFVAGLWELSRRRLAEGGCI